MTFSIDRIVRDSMCLNSKSDIYPMIVEAVNKYVGLQNTEQVRNSIKQEINKILLTAVSMGLLDCYMWNKDNRIEVYPHAYDYNLTMRLPEWILEELDIDPYHEAI